MESLFERAESALSAVDQEDSNWGVDQQIEYAKARAIMAVAGELREARRQGRAVPMPLGN